MSTVTKSPSSRRETTGLVLLFGAMYFVQGIAEPTEGLIAQPVRSLLKSWGYSAAGIAGFGALLALPWSLKPLYGLLTDFVPINRTRRRSYLLLTSAASVLGLACLYFMPVPIGAYRQLLFLLLVPTVGVAFSDVVVDALMVEKGQPRGLTGLLQSVQWAAMYGGSILAGLVGGYLSQHGHQQEGFLMCAVTSFATLLLAWFYVKEKPRPVRKGRLRLATKELAAAARKPAVLAAGAFLFLWSFNPFSMSVLYLHMTKQLAISEQFYGFTISLLSVGAIVGSLTYGTYCRRVPMSRLIHLAIAVGVLSTLAYCGV
ncbi:MAG: MFS transporter, partial [Planctomycetales bacterium]|nr:MFS transporter [Planctomycetales bacterium]